MVKKKSPPKKTAELKKTRVSWGEKAKLVVKSFDCLPQPNLDLKTESILLKKKQEIIEILCFCKKEFSFQSLLLINCVEYKEVFQIIYQLQKFEPVHEMFCIKVNLEKENPEIPSVSKIFESANWFERELWDLQGIKFKNHPDLRRILNPEKWEGFILRKNYIPPVDALNGPITALKDLGSIKRSTRKQIEKIENKKEEA